MPHSTIADHGAFYAVIPPQNSYPNKQWAVVEGAIARVRKISLQDFPNSSQDSPAIAARTSYDLQGTARNGAIQGESMAITLYGYCGHKSCTTYVKVLSRSYPPPPGRNPP
ncbi:MAG: hypothetical protein AAFY26_25485 [Cyanobacteria bacterium J06638_22]